MPIIKCDDYYFFLFSLCVCFLDSLLSVCDLQSLQSLSDLRATPQFPFSGELDLAVGSAVESMGPEVVLNAVPLLITGTEWVTLLMLLSLKNVFWVLLMKNSVINVMKCVVYLFVYSDDLEFPRSWLIPVIRDHVKNTQLAYFTSHFFPLATKLKQTGL